MAFLAELCRPWEPGPLAMSPLWGLEQRRSQANQSVRTWQACGVSLPAGLCVLFQVEHDFILQAERETFIEQMKDIMDKAEDMLSEDTDVDRGSDPGASPPPLSTCGLGAGEVSQDAGFLRDQPAYP